MNASLHVQRHRANTSANTGKYTQTTNPFNVGVTIRFDF